MASNKSAAGAVLYTTSTCMQILSQQRRSAIAERARLHAEWAALKSSDSSCEVLRGVVALVSVGEGSKAMALRAALAALGATVAPEWSPLVTHVVWAPEGSREIRAKARSLAAKIISPLWVEGCATASRRLPERAFPTAARPSDLPSPRMLRQMLRTAEKENTILNVSSDTSKDNSKEKPLRLRISSDKDTSHDTSKDTTLDTSTDISRDENLPSRVNTLPRRALPNSTSPEPIKKSRRKLFTYKDGEDLNSSSEDENKETKPRLLRPSLPTKSTKTTKNTVTKPNKRQPAPSAGKSNKVEVSNVRVTPKVRRELARAERVARTLAGLGPGLGRAGPLTVLGASGTTPRIVLTGMSRTERATAIESIRKLKGKIQSTVNKKTTHVILGSCREDGPITSKVNITGVRAFENRPFGFRNRNDENTDGSTFVNAPNSTCASRMLPTIMEDEDKDRSKARTLNALLGAARGCRILWFEWLEQCAKEGRWLHPYGYEVKHLRKISEKARIERTCLGLSHSEYAYNAFCGIRAKVRPDAEQRDAAILLLNLCGGHVVEHEHDVIVGRDSNDVASKWVFDSVAAARPRTLRRYRVKETVDNIARFVGESRDSDVVMCG